VDGGSYLCMEGPPILEFCRKPDYKAQGHSVIGMTNMPEAKTRPRGGDLLRQRRDGHRFRLLAFRS